MRHFAKWTVIVALIAVAYYGLYMVKWEVRELKHQNTLLEAQILQKERAIQVLNTEWSYLNRPERLKQLAEQHLALKPSQGQQIAEFDRFQLPEAMPESPVMPTAYHRGRSR